MAGVSVRNFTRSRTPRVPFAAVTKKVLPDWDVSLALVGEKKAVDLNKRLRGKSYAPNVLSYAAGEKSGEVIICPVVAKQQAPSYGLSPAAYCLYLFIHGLLHIKGWSHGGTMERCERALLSLYDTARSHRHRHRHIPGKGGGRRGDLR